MKSKIIGLIALFSIASASCKKELPDTCAPVYMLYQNNSANKYQIFLNGVSQGTVNGGTTTKVQINKGPNAVRALQLEGYVLYPSEFTGNISAACGGEYVFKWPQ